LAVIRLSGLLAHEIARRVVAKWPEEPRVATLSHLRDETGNLLDESVVVRYDAPASFTGEDAVELSTHGGSTVPATVVAALIAAGAREATPGEFTRRAVFNGKMDLLQAEAVADLVSATSRAAQRLAMSQLDGGLSRRLLDLRARILGLEALIAYDIDFPEEDDGPVAPERIGNVASDIIEQLGQLLATAPTGELVREGAVVVIAGAPNVGKSSLFNAMLGRRRAIVTDVPGTTRDALEAVVDADGWPVRLVDTAGLRDSTEMIEQLGIEVSRSYLEKADVVLACGDTAEALSAAEKAASANPDAVIVRVQTKADRLSKTQRASDNGRVLVSAETGEGLANVNQAIGAAIASKKGSLHLDAPMVTPDGYPLPRAPRNCRSLPFGRW